LAIYRTELIITASRKNNLSEPLVFLPIQGTRYSARIVESSTFALSIVSILLDKIKRAGMVARHHPITAALWLIPSFATFGFSFFPLSSITRQSLNHSFSVTSLSPFNIDNPNNTFVINTA